MACGNRQNLADCLVADMTALSGAAATAYGSAAAVPDSMNNARSWRSVGRPESIDGHDGIAGTNSARTSCSLQRLQCAKHNVKHRSRAERFYLATT